jgi:uncharacterized phage protein (TIGR02218 family)
MKTVAGALATHIAGEVTTLCTLWRVTRRDGTVMRFTDHSEDVVLGSETFAASTGYTRSAIAANSALQVDNVDLEGMLDSAAITEDDLRAGVYDHAEVDVLMVNWASPSDGTVQMRAGTLGEVSLTTGTFTAELRGLAQALQTQVIELVTPDCRATFGDARCGFDLSTVTETGTVATVTTARRVVTVTLTGARADGFFSGGLLTWTSGLNDGRAMEVKEHSGGTFTLFLPTGFAIQVGDAFSVSAGCPKTLAACIAFDNVANFRGFPWVPGNDAMLRTPNAN